MLAARTFAATAAVALALQAAALSPDCRADETISLVKEIAEQELNPFVREVAAVFELKGLTTAYNIEYATTTEHDERLDAYSCQARLSATLKTRKAASAYTSRIVYTVRSLTNNEFVVEVLDLNPLKLEILADAGVYDLEQFEALRLKKALMGPALQQGQ